MAAQEMIRAGQGKRQRPIGLRQALRRKARTCQLVGGNPPRRAPDSLMVSGFRQDALSMVAPALQGFLALETFLLFWGACM